MPAIHSPDQVVTYPLHRILAVVPNADSAARDLQASGFGQDLWVLDDQAMARAFDPQAQRESAGIAHSITRKLAELAGYETGQFQQYQEAAAAGSLVLGVDVSSSPDARSTVSDILVRHGAHHVRYYGPMTVENLHKAPSAL